LTVHQEAAVTIYVYNNLHRAQAIRVALLTQDTICAYHRQPAENATTRYRVALNKACLPAT